MPVTPLPNDSKIRTTTGHVVHDDLGNAIWKTDAEVLSSEAMLDLLQADQLSLADMQRRGTGFDPYSKGESPLRYELPTRPTTDLRALSAQILAERARKQSAG